MGLARRDRPVESGSGDAVPATRPAAAIRRMTMETVRRRVLVSGRVQGVGYRVACAREAAAAGVAGRVRNLPDGEVEAVFEGPPPQVDALVAWCRRGPRSAVVRDVRVRDEPVTGQIGFAIG
jgi:acylphosphatase